MTEALRSRLRTRNDDGIALVLVLVVSVLLVAVTGVVLTTVVASFGSANHLRATSQSEMAAETGLAASLTNIRNAMVAEDAPALPCSGSGALTVPGASSTYSVTIGYSVSGSPLTCPLSVPSSSERINVAMASSGSAAHGAKVVMKEDLTIDVTVNTSPSAPGADGYAIYTDQNLALAGDVHLTSAPGQPPPDIYSQGTLTCGTGDVSAGSVITYQPASLTGSCTFAGNLIGSSSIALGGSTTVDGYVESFGQVNNTSTCPDVNTGTKKNPVLVYYGLCTSGGVVVNGNFIEAGGNAYLDNGTIGGNVYASGSVFETGNPAVTGTVNPNDTSHPDTPPATVPFPATPIAQIQSSPFAADWTVVPISSSECASYFADNGYTGATGTPDGFELALEQQTVPTIYEAPSCAVSFIKNIDSFFLNNLANPSSGPNGADAVLEVQSFTMGKGGRTYCEESTAYKVGTPPSCSTATSAGPDLIIQADGTATACTTSTTDVSLTAADNFEPSIAVLVYSYGIVSYANDSGMTGQIQACGGEDGTNTFNLAFNPAASEILSGSGGSPTVTYGTPVVVDKYLASG